MTKKGAPKEFSYEAFIGQHYGRFPPLRTFEGADYYLWFMYVTKKEAQRDAAHARLMGYRARVVPYQGHWALFVRKKITW